MRTGQIVMGWINIMSSERGNMYSIFSYSNGNLLYTFKSMKAALKVMKEHKYRYVQDCEGNRAIISGSMIMYL